MNQNVWGPHAWFFLHSITMNYPFNPSEEQKQRTKSFFYDAQHMLPCKYCRDNYKRNLKETPIRLENRQEIVHWLIDLHNEVNGQTGKRHYSYDEVLKIYEKAYNKRIPLTESDAVLSIDKGSIELKFPLFVLGTIGLLYLVYKNRKSLF